MGEQVPYSDGQAFGTSSFAENPEPRCPCILVLDTSGSMSGDPISELNAGLVTLKDELMADSLAALRVEIAVVTFGPVRVVADFQSAHSFQPPNLAADGGTPMGAAVTRALELLAQRKLTYRSNGIKSYKPWVFMITDGAPTDQWDEAARAAKAADRSDLAFFAVGVEGANLDVLRHFTNREPLKLKGLRFRDLFQWLSASLRSVSRSTPGDNVPVENPVAPGGWASV